MAKRKCRNCGKPLGSTYELCHECGGKTIRADRASGAPTTIPLVRSARAGLADLFGGDDGD